MVRRSNLYLPGLCGGGFKNVRPIPRADKYLGARGALGSRHKPYDRSNNKTARAIIFGAHVEAVGSRSLDGVAPPFNRGEHVEGNFG
jgi:hypothetical protein